MTGRELSDKLNYTGMEIAVRKLALKEKLASAEKIAVMSELDVCDLLSKHYELVFFLKVRISVLLKKKMHKNYSRC